MAFGRRSSTHTERGGSSHANERRGSISNPLSKLRRSSAVSIASMSSMGDQSFEEKSRRAVTSGSGEARAARAAERRRRRSSTSRREEEEEEIQETAEERKARIIKETRRAMLQNEMLSLAIRQNLIPTPEVIAEKVQAQRRRRLEAEKEEATKRTDSYTTVRSITNTAWPSGTHMCRDRKIKAAELEAEEHSMPGTTGRKGLLPPPGTQPPPKAPDSPLSPPTFSGRASPLTTMKRAQAFKQSMPLEQNSEYEMENHEIIEKLVSERKGQNSPPPRAAGLTLDGRPRQTGPSSTSTTRSKSPPSLSRFAEKRDLLVDSSETVPSRASSPQRGLKRESSPQRGKLSANSPWQRVSGSGNSSPKRGVIGANSPWRSLIGQAKPGMESPLVAMRGKLGLKQLLGQVRKSNASTAARAAAKARALEDRLDKLYSSRRLNETEQKRTTLLQNKPYIFDGLEVKGRNFTIRPYAAGEDAEALFSAAIQLHSQFCPSNWSSTASSKNSGEHELCNLSTCAFWKGIYEGCGLPLCSSADDLEHSLTTDVHGGDAQSFSIVDNTSGDCIGCIVLVGHSPENLRIEIGSVLVLPQSRHQTGEAQYPAAINDLEPYEGMHLLMSYLFDELGYLRVGWHLNLVNRKAAALPLKLGFTFEGITRYVGKERLQPSIFRVLDLDWKAKAKRLQYEAVHNTHSAALKIEKLVDELQAEIIAGNESDDDLDNGASDESLDPQKAPEQERISSPTNAGISYDIGGKIWNSRQEIWKTHHGLQDDNDVDDLNGNIRLVPLTQSAGEWEGGGEVFTRLSQRELNWRFHPDDGMEDFRRLRKYLWRLNHWEEGWMAYNVVDALGNWHGVIFCRVRVACRQLELGPWWFTSRTRTIHASAFYLLLEHAMDRGCERIELLCRTEVNGPAFLALRFGFTFEAVLMQWYVANGDSKHVLCLSLTSSKWGKVQALQSRMVREVQADTVNESILEDDSDSLRFSIHFKDGKLGLILSDGPPVYVTGLVPKTAAARDSFLIQEVDSVMGPLVVAVNDQPASGKDKRELAKMLRKAGRPVKITFWARSKRVTVPEKSVEEYWESIRTANARRSSSVPQRAATSAAKPQSDLERLVDRPQSGYPQTI